MLFGFLLVYLGLVFCLFFVEFGIVLLGDSVVFLRWLLKPFLMISLIGFFIVFVDLRVVDFLVVLALFLSLFGDVFLMFSGDRCFLFGLFSFFMAHLFYIVFFVVSSGASLFAVSALRYILFLPPLFVVFLFLYRFRGRLSEEGVYVFIYAFILVLMVFVSALRLPSEPLFNISVLLTYFGGFLFLVSDLLIAWSRYLFSMFLEPFIILLYGLAQLFIVIGLVLA
ncbi:lysoplasmalogenase [Methanonatronarchaeum sp. AMET-Sl]|uniref:lysoplasmalogenase n=1 Tax=Methanonatronarchaeum sp. AMET-Sl TaxID=3037654 RepID=UPI00244DA01C|nr:lysoplasmalogenase [Methanonatronarchaeum sp. AMET-Sl]WGI17064.1 lysoplasmalogenase [Methanonatronarchaeum sp. AMET-Sl]